MQEESAHAVPEQPSTEVVCVRIEGSASVAFAHALRTKLLEELDPERDAVVHLDVDRIDASGVQLLLASRRWLARHGRGLTVVVGEGPTRRALEISGALPLLAQVILGPRL